MDNVALRTRYPRHGMAARRKKKSVREPGGYKEKLAKQIVVSVLILMIAGIIKNANTSVTNFICDKAKDIFTQNIELQSVYNGIENLLDRAFKKDSSDNNSQEGLNNNIPTDESDGINNDVNRNEGEFGTEENEQEQNQALSSTPTPAPKPTAASSQAVSPAASTNKDIFVTPVSGLLGEGFGERVHPFTKEIKMHKGVDIEANQDSSIKAAASGDVIEAGYEKTLGYYVKIQHSNGLSTIYAHCSQLIAKKGQKVKQGDVIAKVGSTGLSTGAHLHFEIWKDGKAVDPLGYIKVPEK